MTFDSRALELEEQKGSMEDLKGLEGQATDGRRNGLGLHCLTSRRTVSL